MTAQEKLELIKANPGCWLYKKIDVWNNTLTFRQYCKTRENACLEAMKFNENSCSAYFYNYHCWIINDENHSDYFIHYNRWDNSEVDKILDHVDKVVLIESADHKTLWSEKEIDGKVLIGRFLFSESFLQDVLTQQALLENQCGEEPTSIRLKGVLYSKEQLEAMLDKLEAMKKLLNS